MDRNLVDDNPESHCSSGLHFCSESYLQSFGGASNPVMILKINPADVVSIPTDYNGAKGRCMKYEVVAEVDGDPKVAFASVVDKKYAPAKVPNAVLSPQAVWPFSINPVVSTWPTPTVDTGYSLLRMRGGQVVATGLTLQEARDKVAAAIRQKKATLVIRDSHGNPVK